ncbi:hypothetical protein SNE40_007082 [Patella caerulea]|uniref:Uncharacterized protein n=1 Tax=Patella caerulea TaxID=87958 RepID=A0AAN8Q7S8_PATCE
MKKSEVESLMVLTNCPRLVIPFVSLSMAGLLTTAYDLCDDIYDKSMPMPNVKKIQPETESAVVKPNSGMGCCTHHHQSICKNLWGVWSV